MSNETAGILEKSSDKPFYGWIILATGMAVATVCFGFFYSFGVFFTDLQADFNSTRAGIAIIASMMSLFQSLMGFLSGWATDKYGPRLAVIVTGILFSVGLFIGSRATNLMQMYIGIGFCVGCGISVFFVYITTLARWFIKLRGLTQGMIAAGIGIGMMIMNPISAKLLTNYGWRTSFIIIAIAGVIVFSIGALIVRKNPQEKGLQPYGMAELSANAVYSNHIKTPVTEKDMTLQEALKTRDLWLLTGVNFSLLLTIFMVATHLVNYAKDTGMAPTSAALLMTMIGAVSIAGKVGAGSLSDKLSSRKIMLAAAIMEICLMVWLSTSMSIWMFRVFAVLHGLAYGGIAATTSVITAKTFGVTHMGKIMGISNLGVAGGGVLGPWLAGSVFDSTGSYAIAFVIAAGFCITAAVCLLFVGKHRITANEPQQKGSS